MAIREQRKTSNAGDTLVTTKWEKGREEIKRTTKRTKERSSSAGNPNKGEAVMALKIPKENIKGKRGIMAILAKMEKRGMFPKLYIIRGDVRMRAERVTQTISQILSLFLKKRTILFRRAPLSFRK